MLYALGHRLLELLVERRHHATETSAVCGERDA